MANDTISQVHIGESNYDICDAKNREDVKDLQTYIDEEMYSASEVDDLLSTKVDEADFVDEPTGKEDGIEIVLPQGTPTSPIVLSEIDDSDELKHSTVHTSSNHYINTKLEALNNSLAGKMSIQFVDELPASPDRNTQYYVETETTGVWNIYISDNLGVVRAAGTTELDMDSYVRSTTKVAGVKLEADISAQQIEDATKSLSATLTNKSIDASDNTISNIATTNMASSAIATSIGDSPVDTKLATEKSIYDYAVPKVSTASQVYGSSSNYTLATSISNASTAAQIPTAKSIYDYAVPKTSTANQIYGSSANYTLSTAIGDSSTATQIPTAKSIYDYAVPLISEASKIYGTTSEGVQYAFPISSEYKTASSSREIATRSAVHGAYDELLKALKEKTIVLNSSASMVTGIGWSNTRTFLLIPAPPLATSVSVSKSSTLTFMLRDNNVHDTNVTVTSVGTWGTLADGYAKVSIDYASSAGVAAGVLMAYCLSGTLTVKFS